MTLVAREADLRLATASCEVCLTSRTSEVNVDRESWRFSRGRSVVAGQARFAEPARSEPSSTGNCWPGSHRSGRGLVIAVDRQSKGMRHMGLKAGWEGRYFEDFEAGDVYQHPLGRTITEADNVWFTLLTMNTAQTHFNSEVGRASEFGRSLVNSAFTLAVGAGQSVMDTSWNAVANLAWDQVKLPAPVFVGDTLYSETLVLGKRESKSRPHAGIITVKTRTLNQNGDEVLSFVRSFLVYKRSAEGQRPGDSFPKAKTPLVAADSGL